MSNFARLCLLVPLLACANKLPVRLDLWEGVPPGETLRMATGANPYGTVKDTRRENVFTPDIEFFPATSPGSPLILIFPGGGYNILAEDHEGVGVARRLQSLGCAAAVVRYRVPRRDPQRPWIAPLLDAQQALKIVRQRASECNANPDKIVALGFSAGGNLVARLAYQPNASAELRPNYAAIIYPAYLLDAAQGNKVLLSGPDGVTPALGSHPTPAFFVHSADDPIPANGSIALAAALRLAGSTAETHIYAAGGHGWGVNGKCPASREWPELLAAWLRGQGVLGGK
jgi:acetyl esterase/lipase